MKFPSPSPSFLPCYHFKFLNTCFDEDEDEAEDDDAFPETDDKRRIPILRWISDNSFMSFSMDFRSKYVLLEGANLSRLITKNHAFGWGLPSGLGILYPVLPII